MIDMWPLTIVCALVIIAIIISIDLYRGLAELSRPFFKRVMSGVGLIMILISIAFIEYDDIADNLIYYTIIVFLLGLLHWLWLRRNRIKDDDRLELMAKVDNITDEAE